MRTRAILLAHAGGEDETTWLDRRVSRHVLPVANKPILVHALESMARAGIEEAAITVPAGERPTIAEAVGSGDDWGVRVHYLPTRTTDELPAILAASHEFLDGHPFVLQHGDGILRHDLVVRQAHHEVYSRTSRFE